MRLVRLETGWISDLGFRNGSSSSNLELRTRNSEGWDEENRPVVFPEKILHGPHGPPPAATASQLKNAPF